MGLGREPSENALERYQLARKPIVRRLRWGSQGGGGLARYHMTELGLEMT